MKHNRKGRRSLKIGFIMDPMDRILLPWDTSISIMLEARKRGHRIFYIEPHDMFYQEKSVYANLREVMVSRKTGFQVLNRRLTDLKTLDIIFNRKEPPFNVSYLYLTHLLEFLEPNVFVINSPRGLRKANEKLYILKFGRWVPSSLVTNNAAQIERFQKRKKFDLILKPLDQKGGAGIKLLPFRLKRASQILKEMTQNGKRWIIAQKFLKQNLTKGDKRILILNGKTIGQFSRIPKRGEFRANLSLGGKHVRASLTVQERSLIQALRPALIRDGLYFVGIDVVDGKLIEINVTSPAGIPEINELEGKRPEAEVLDFLEARALRRLR